MCNDCIRKEAFFILFLRPGLDSTERRGRPPWNALLFGPGERPARPRSLPRLLKIQHLQPFSPRSAASPKSRPFVPGGSDHGHPPGALPQYLLRPPGPATYLRVAHGLNGAVIGRAKGGEVDQHVYLWVFLHGISHVLEDGDQDLLVTPVKLLLVVPTVRKEEEGSGQPVRVGEGRSRGGASSSRWKGRVLPSKSFGYDPGMRLSPV